MNEELLHDIMWYIVIPWLSLIIGLLVYDFIDICKSMARARRYERKVTRLGRRANDYPSYYGVDDGDDDDFNAYK